jgi:ribonuclease inhibitor
MQTIYLDGNLYDSKAALYAALGRMLDLPDYFGMNADALNDCLSERREPVSLWVASRGQGDVADQIKTVIDVFEENGSSVRETEEQKG